MGKRIKIITLILFAVLLLALAGCSSKSNKSEDFGKAEGDSNVVVETTRKLTYTVDITINSTRAAGDIQEIGAKVIEVGGYAGNSSIDYGEDSVNGYIYYRVPTNKLDEFLDFINKNEGLIKKSINVNDITTQYNEIDARLETLIASKAAYEDTLANGGVSYSEKIMIITKIEEIDTEIAQLNKGKASYDNLLDYSMIKITFTGSSNPDSFFKDYGEYLITFFFGVFTVIMYLLPIALVGFCLFAVVYFPIRIIIKRRMDKTNKK
jgi:hypothetical protein